MNTKTDGMPGRSMLTCRRTYELLDRLNEKMPPLRQPAGIYVIGGAAMMFEYDAGRETEDVDCIIEDYREEVIEAAEQVAAENREFRTTGSTRTHADLNYCRRNRTPTSAIRTTAAASR